MFKSAIPYLGPFGQTYFRIQNFRGRALEKVRRFGRVMNRIHKITVLKILDIPVMTVVTPERQTNDAESKIILKLLPGESFQGMRQSPAHSESKK